MVEYNPGIRKEIISWGQTVRRLLYLLHIKRNNHQPTPLMQSWDDEESTEWNRRLLEDLAASRKLLLGEKAHQPTEFIIVAWGHDALQNLKAQSWNSGPETAFSFSRVYLEWLFDLPRLRMLSKSKDPIESSEEFGLGWIQYVQVHPIQKKAPATVWCTLNRPKESIRLTYRPNSFGAEAVEVLQCSQNEPLFRTELRLFQRGTHNLHITSYIDSKMANDVGALFDQQGSRLTLNI